MTWDTSTLRAGITAEENLGFCSKPKSERERALAKRDNQTGPEFAGRSGGELELSSMIR